MLASYYSNIITIEEYALLFEENSSNNLDSPYYNYPSFNLETQSDPECRANHIPTFACRTRQRFPKERRAASEAYRSTEALNWQTYNRLYGSVNLFSCLCETSVVVASKVKISAENST